MCKFKCHDSCFCMWDCIFLVCHRLIRQVDAVDAHYTVEPLHNKVHGTSKVFHCTGHFVNITHRTSHNRAFYFNNRRPLFNMNSKETVWIKLITLSHTSPRATSASLLYGTSSRWPHTVSAYQITWHNQFGQHERNRCTLFVLLPPNISGLRKWCSVGLLALLTGLFKHKKCLSAFI